MIKSRSDLKYYLECDEYARFGTNVSWWRKFKLGEMWRFQVYLRKLEYWTNINKGVFSKLMSVYHKYRLKKIGMKLSWSIAPNTFGPGMCLVHYGTVVVNGGAKIGANCRVHACVNIGANGGGDADTPRIGNNVYIGPGAKLFGHIEIADDIVIGANSVVNKSFVEKGVTIAGAPAKIVSYKDRSNLIKRIHKEL